MIPRVGINPPTAIGPFVLGEAILVTRSSATCVTFEVRAGISS